MDKKKYERLTTLRAKEAKGTATFTERNIIKMEEKRLRKETKAKALAALAKAQPSTRSTKRFGGRPQTS